MGESAGFGKSQSSGSSSVRIPRFARPLARDSVSTSQGALAGLRSQLGGASADDLVAGFTLPQEIAQVLGINRALGDDSIFSTATDTLRDAAGGVDLSRFIPSTALDSLTSTASGVGLPANILERLQPGQIPGLDQLGILGDRRLPTSILDTIGEDRALPGTDVLGGILGGGSSIDPTTLETLQRTAGGDFLFGGPGFDEAVDAAVRRATPGIIRTFGQGGSGSATGSLAQEAVGQAGIDAFAQQFARERQNQLSAASILGELGLAETGQQADIASTLASLGLAEGDQEIGANRILAELGLAETGQQADIASTLASLGLAEEDLGFSMTQLLAGLGENAQDRQLGASQFLANLGLSERANQLDAATLLPDIGNADLDLLQQIGLDQQSLNQRRLSAPIDANLQLLLASLGVVDPQSLFGSRSNQTGSTFQLGFGGA